MAQAQQLLPNLDLNDGIYDNRNLVVVHQKGEIAADFFLHFLVSDFLRRFGSQSRIILVLNHTNVNRWISVSSRLGYNLQNLIDRGQLEIVDLLRASYQAIISRISSGQGEFMPTSENTNNTVSSDHIDIEQLIPQIQEKLRSAVTSSSKTGNDAKTGEPKRILILFEDLSDLYLSQRPKACINSASNLSTDFGENDKPLLTFVRQLKSLSIDSFEGHISVLTLVKSNCMDDVSRRFSNLITQVLSSVVFEISPLVTGFSTNISGFLTIKCHRNNRYVNSSTMERHWTKSHNYKLEDRSIKITPL